jgi:hypothetical protein
MRILALALIACSLLASGCARRDTDWGVLAGAVGKTIQQKPDPESRPIRRP